MVEMRPRQTRSVTSHKQWVVHKPNALWWPFVAEILKATEFGGGEGREGAPEKKTMEKFAFARQVWRLAPRHVLDVTAHRWKPMRSTQRRRYPAWPAMLQPHLAREERLIAHETSQRLGQLDVDHFRSELVTDQQPGACNPRIWAVAEIAVRGVIDLGHPKPNHRYPPRLNLCFPASHA